ncbi:MAG TPA: 30S ribosomal protein S4 [Candidatus Saccharimonadales bacterium]|jgi:small subunit ribosomal protein S4|nr:30S ribosomal protein S4 [Candidatus Saccharimonadales bacterium]
MARDRSPIVKQSRREGYALHPKAHKIMAKKSGIPGVHAHGRQTKPSMYSIQLREKQKVRRLYGMLEKQFAKLMKEAGRTKGQSGQVLLQLLERRLDNVIYRAGWSVSRRGARQLASHGHLMVNGTRVDVPSIRVKEGDVITVRPASMKGHYFTHLDDVLKETNQSTLSWMKSDPKKMVITITGLPKREEADPDINEQLIVEYYSR